MFPYISCYLMILFFGFPLCSVAQVEADEKRSSLRGLQGVGFTVNIEQNTAFADTQLVKIETVRALGLQQLRQGDINIFDDRLIRKSIQTPVLYLHINLLSTKTGIISFGITANLYQPVELILSNQKEITASTWETSVVGIATYDKIGVINEAAMGVIRSFIDDYHEINSHHN